MFRSSRSLVTAANHGAGGVLEKNLARGGIDAVKDHAHIAIQNIAGTTGNPIDEQAGRRASTDAVDLEMFDEGAKLRRGFRRRRRKRRLDRSRR
jgi:hypothetical protein